MSSKFIEMHEADGKTIATTVDMNDVLYIRFTDDTYAAIHATFDGCCESCYENSDVYLTERRIDNVTPTDAKALHKASILDEAEYQEAIDTYNEKLQRVRSEDEKNERAKLAALLAKYPDMKGDNQ